MQKQWTDEARYLDREGIIYQFPRRYRAAIEGYERFVYYRPAKDAPSHQASTYFGYGELGDVFVDPNRDDHFYVNIRKYRELPSPVFYRDAADVMYESHFPSPSAFQGRAIRAIEPTTFFRILAAGGVVGDPFRLDDAENVLLGGFVGLLAGTAPKYALQTIREIPEGTGYQPSGNGRPDVYETAALQERARGDHQRVLGALAHSVHGRGGTTFFNNNIDLFAVLGLERLPVEAKSLQSMNVAVDRMRYGIGQLTDYGIRYRAELGRAQPVLAFGRVPDRETAWIGDTLERAGIAFVAVNNAQPVPLNARAERLSIFS